MTRLEEIISNNKDTDSINAYVKIYLLNSFYFYINILIGDTISRTIRFIIEFKYYQKHYDIKNRKINIFYRVYSYKPKTKIMFSLVFIIIAIVYLKDTNFWYHLIINSAIIPVYIIFKYFDADRSQLDLSKWIRTGSRCDYASGMASNYFHGYININVPSIRERMKNYEDEQHVKFAIKRLFVTIPDSMHCRPVFRSKILERVDTPLGEIVLNRAGCKRPYKFDVHRFTEKINGKYYYISVEGATPLLTFHESLQSSITNTPDMIDLKREILLQFYESIKKYSLENKDTSKEIEFVYYKDYDNNIETDVGYILKDRIEKMLRENQD